MRDPRSRFGSVREWLYHELRTRIVSGDLAAGQPLRSRPLTQQYGVSVSPLREAIHQLAADGFVDLSPQKGARVAPVDADDLVELYRARMLLEPEAARQSVARSDDDHVEDVASTFEQLARHGAATPGRRAEHALREEEFLAAVCGRAANRWLTSALDTLRTHTARARTISGRRTDSGADIDRLAAIRDALLQRDPNAAGERMVDFLLERIAAAELIG